MASQVGSPAATIAATATTNFVVDAVANSAPGNRHREERPHLVCDSSRAAATTAAMFVTVGHDSLRAWRPRGCGRGCVGVEHRWQRPRSRQQEELRPGLVALQPWLVGSSRPSVGTRGRHDGAVAVHPRRPWFQRLRAAEQASSEATTASREVAVAADQSGGGGGLKSRARTAAGQRRPRRQRYSLKPQRPPAATSRGRGRGLPPRSPTGRATNTKILKADKIVVPAT